jgi:hypothetical protein
MPTKEQKKSTPNSAQPASAAIQQLYKKLSPEAAQMYAHALTTYYMKEDICSSSEQIAALSKKLPYMLFNIKHMLRLRISIKDIKAINTMLNELPKLDHATRRGYPHHIQNNCSPRSNQVNHSELNQSDIVRISTQLIDEILEVKSQQPDSRISQHQIGVNQQELEPGLATRCNEVDFFKLLITCLKSQGYSQQSIETINEVIKKLEKLNPVELEQELKEHYITESNAFLAHINYYINWACIIGCIFEILNPNNYEAYQLSANRTLTEMLNKNNSTCGGNPQSNCHIKELNNWLAPWISFYLFEGCSTLELTKGVLSFVKVYLPVMLTYLYISINSTGVLLAILLMREIWQNANNTSITYKGEQFTEFEKKILRAKANQLAEDFPEVAHKITVTRNANDIALNVHKKSKSLSHLTQCLSSTYSQLEKFWLALAHYLSNFFRTLSDTSTCIVPPGIIIIGAYTFISILSAIIYRTETCNTVGEFVKGIDCRTEIKFTDSLNQTTSVHLTSIPDRSFSAIDLFKPFPRSNITKLVCFKPPNNNTNTDHQIKEIIKILQVSAPKFFPKAGLKKTLKNIINSIELCLEFKTELMLESIAFYYAMAAQAEIYCYYILLNFLAVSFTTSFTLSIAASIINRDYTKKPIYLCMKKIGDGSLKFLSATKTLGAALFVFFFFHVAFTNREAIFNSLYSKAQLWDDFKQFLLQSIKHTPPTPASFITLSMLAFFQMQIYLPDVITTLAAVTAAALLSLITMCLFSKTPEFNTGIKTCLSGIERVYSTSIKFLKITFKSSTIITAFLKMIILTNYCNLPALITNGYINTAFAAIYNNLPSSSQNSRPQPYYPNTTTINHTSQNNDASHNSKLLPLCEYAKATDEGKNFVAIDYIYFIAIISLNTITAVASCIYATCCTNYCKKARDSNPVDGDGGAENRFPREENPYQQLGTQPDDSDSPNSITTHARTISGLFKNAVRELLSQNPTPSTNAI